MCEGGRVPFGSDCTRWPVLGLCSLTNLEATLGRHPFPRISCALRVQ